jgi:hypothetical protein
VDGIGICKTTVLGSNGYPEDKSDRINGSPRHDMRKEVGITTVRPKRR